MMRYLSEFQEQYIHLTEMTLLDDESFFSRLSCLWLRSSIQFQHFTVQMCFRQEKSSSSALNHFDNKVFDGLIYSLKLHGRIARGKLFCLLERRFYNLLLFGWGNQVAAVTALVTSIRKGSFQDCLSWYLGFAFMYCISFLERLIFAFGSVTFFGLKTDIQEKYPTACVLEDIQADP